MKKIKELIKDLPKIEYKGDLDLMISSIEFDSRKISPSTQEASSLYVAQKGTQSDGHLFIKQAIVNGTNVIVCEEFPATIHENVTYIKVPDSSIALGRMASAFYDYPSQKLKLIGVTGTNGKTTIVTLLYNLFRSLDYSTGLISTIENRINDTVIKSTHTTPDAITLNHLLSEMVKAGCQYCFMEVSSHAVCQHRIEGLEFAGGIFTNITHDHLDFHKTFTQYIQAKKAFFDHLPEQAFALVNKDDKNGLVMTQNSQANIKTYSLNGIADFKGKILDNSFEGLQMMINQQEAYFRLSGKFNAYNLLAIYGTAFLLGISQEDLLVKMSSLQSASGRFQLLRNDKDCKAIVDYAHTPDALQNVLTTIKDITQNSVELITVVGCGGDRDSSKRPEMAEIACRYSNKVILTSDNPRTEDPAKILKDMEVGIPVEFRQNVLVIENRKEAIRTASMLLQKGGILLVAGKGHENYQEINGIKHHFDDTEVLNEFFQNTNH